MAALSALSPHRMLDNIKRMEEAELPSLPSIQPNLDYDSAFDTSQEESDEEGYEQYQRGASETTPHPHRRSGSTLAASTVVPDAESSFDEEGDDVASERSGGAKMTPHPHRLGPHAEFKTVADAESSFDEEGESAASERSRRAKMTPHPHRLGTHAESNFDEGESSTSSAPFPPLPRAQSSSPDTYVPGRAGTSTPFSLHSRSRRLVSDNDNDTRSTARHLSHSRNRSDTGEYGAANSTGKEQWHTPGEMSGSFSGDAILPDVELPSLPNAGELGSERSIPMNDETENSFESLAAETPLTRRFSKSHVTMQRPGRRSQSLANADSTSPKMRIPTPISESPASNPHERLVEQERVPSLSKSEASATDTSGAASTPEAPSRQAGAHSFARVLHEDDQSLPEGSVEDAPTYDYQYSASLQEPYDETPAPRRRVSPNKLWTTTPAQYSTPGLARDAPHRVDDVNSAYGASEGSFGALRDLTNQFQDMPFTPSPVGLMSKNSDLSTPRAPLDDAERRKSHVLAVLSSSVAPGRRIKTPHPLRRVSMSPSTEQGTPVQATPTPFFDRSLSAPPNESFVSVASSADLTTDRRATGHNRLSRGNTSFPNMLLPSHAANTSAQSSVRVNDRRADGIKIHKHLNAMNKQLLESNADLAREAEAWRDEAERLKGLLEGAGVEHSDVDVLANIARSREASFALGPQDSAQQLLEGMSPEENAAVMQELAEKLENLEEILNDKDAQIVELQDELAGLREGKGGDVVASLEAQLEEAEQARTELHADFALKTEQHAAKFSEICSSFEEQVAGLSKELATARAEVQRLRGEKERLEETTVSSSEGRDAELRKQVHELQTDLDRAKQMAETRAKELQAVEERLGEVRAEHAELVARAMSAEEKLEDLERQFDEVDGELQAKEEAVEGLLADKEEMERQIEELNAELERAGAGEQTEHLVERIRELESELDSRPPVDVAEEADHLRREVDELNQLLEARDTEIEGLQGKLDLAELAAQPMRQSIASPRKTTEPEVSTADQASFVAAIEERLDEAYREIGRLKHELTSTPHRKSSIEAKDARIKALEREKDSLQERLANRVEPGTPSVASPIGRPTPVFNRALARLKTPKTPGSLKELSWMQTTVADANEPILRAQVEYLQSELDNVNGQLDSNFSRLEEAGLGSIALAEKLAAAQARIGELEDEIRALLQRNKASLALVHAQREENGRADEERLRVALGEVHDQLDALRAEAAREKGRMQGDNSRLKAALDELRATSEQEIERMHRETEDLLDAAHSDVEQAKRDAIAATQETADVRKELDAVQGNVRQLERDVGRIQGDLEASQRRHASQLADKVPNAELARKEQALDRAESQLRDARADADDVSARLRLKTEALARATQQVRDLEGERARVTLAIEAFERDLQVQTIEAGRLREQLLLLRDNDASVQVVRAELRRMEMERGQARDEVQRLKSEMRALEQWRSGHACGGDTQLALEQQRARFKVQTRELGAQIRYLKAKFTREATFRNGLALQKRYLLLMIGGMSLTEQATLKAISQMGYPVPEAPRPKRTFKAVGLAVLGLVRARKSASVWKAEKEAKIEAAAMFAERRRVSGAA